MPVNDLVQTAQEKKYTDFEVQAKEELNQRVANALQSQGYFDRLNQAVSGQDKQDLKENKGTYKEFVQKLLKKFNVTSPAELEGSEKKKYFDELDAGWDGKDEKPEPGDK